MGENVGKHRRKFLFPIVDEVTQIIDGYIDTFELDSDYDRESEAIVFLNTIAAAYGVDRYIERPEC